MSVTVGFSQASTSLIAPASGTPRPDGAATDGAATGSEAGLFAKLLAMLAPGLKPPAEAEAAATATVGQLVGAVTGNGPLPVETPDLAPAAETSPGLGELTQSEAGKTLLKEFIDALKAARTALDEGKPLDPALEKKLSEAVDAVAAWFAGQPQLQPATVDTTGLAEAASGSAILPAAPDAPDATIGSTEPAPKSMQAQAVPAGLAEFGDVLKDFAAQLKKLSPDLSSALARLADRIGVGDIADDVLAQLGLTRTADSTSPELDQLLAALTGAARPANKPANTPAIAAPVLDIPDVLGGETQVVPASDQKPETRKADAPAEPSPRASASVALDTEVTLEARPTAEEKPTAHAPASAPAAKAEDTVPAANQATTTVPAAPAVTAATATRAIHAAYAAPVQQINLPQVAFEVLRHFDAGNTRFQIRLDPPELGRIDVKLDVDRSGTVNARMVVERPETLDLMMRDQRALQLALQQAGLDSSRTNLEFSLRQNPFAGSGGEFAQGDGNGGRSGFGPFGSPAPDESAELSAQTLYRGSASASGVNLFV